MLFEREDRLKEELSKMIEIYDNAPMGVVIIDKKDDSFPIKFINKWMLETFNYPTYSSLLNKDVNILLPNAQKTKHKTQLEKWFEDPFVLQMSKRAGSVIGVTKNNEQINLGIKVMPHEIKCRETLISDHEIKVYAIAYIIDLDQF